VDSPRTCRWWTTVGVAGGGVVLECRPLGDWLAGRNAHGVPLAGGVRVRLQLEVLGEAAG
jgi:hypothetical protein